MVLGLENVPGIGSIFGSFNLGGFLQGISTFMIALFIFAVVGGLTAFFLIRKNDALLYNIRIFWFEEVNGQMVPVGDDWCRELTIPNSNIIVFYIKKKNLFMPRGSKRMGKLAYWYCIKNNKELVNFTMKNMNKEMTEGTLDYDHTDMRYAWTNLKDLIKRNYKDKSQAWWREYKDIISLAVLIFMLSICFYFLISKTAEIVDKAGAILEAAKVIYESAQANQGSGVIQ